MKQALTKGIAAVITIAGLIGVALQIGTSTEPFRKWGIILIVTTVLIVGVSLWVIEKKRRGRAESALAPLRQLDDICVAYRIRQATIEEIDWIADLQSNVYSHEDAIPLHVLLEWYKANPNGFSVITMTNGQKIGHIDILPLRRSTLDSFVQGNIKERDIRGDSLFSPEQADQITHLYVESIIVHPPKGYSNAPAVLCVLSNFVELIKRLCNADKVGYVYAIAASDSGERLMRRLGFDKIGAADKRIDRHDLFSVRFDELRENIKTICGARFPEVRVNADKG